MFVKALLKLFWTDIAVESPTLETFVTGMCYVAPPAPDSSFVVDKPVYIANPNNLL